MTERFDISDLTRCLNQLTAADGGATLDERSEALLGAFERHLIPEGLRSVDAQELFDAVGHRADESLGLLASSDVRVRHLAAYCCGASRDGRVVEPLIQLQTRGPHDFFAHDHVYSACRRLGEHALAELERIARSDDHDMSFVAVQALGQSRADALPALRRLYADGIRPRAFFMALYNLRDPRSADIVWDGLQATGATLSDATSAAFAVLEAIEEGGDDHASFGIDREAWARRFEELLDHDDNDVSGFALEYLGYVGDEASIARLEALLDDEDQGEYAQEAIDRIRKC